MHYHTSAALEEMTAYDQLGPQTRAALASTTYCQSAYILLEKMRRTGLDPFEVDAYMAGHIKRLGQVREMEREQALSHLLANHRAADASSDPFQRHPEESGDNSGPSSPAP